MAIGGRTGSVMNIIINFYFLLSPYRQTMSGIPCSPVPKKGPPTPQSKGIPKKEPDPDPDPSYTRDDLSFVKEPPEVISIECPICLQIMLKDISLTSCGHHFCTSCIERIHGACPECRTTPYQIFPDANRQRIISGLQVYCSNKKDGCTWKGELKNLSGHINKDERVGECQFEVVKCHYWNGLLCSAKMKRADLAKHEENRCQRRPYTCQYCGKKDTYWGTTYYHYDKCPRYPVPCPNKCDPKKTMPREGWMLIKRMNVLLNQLPVSCVGLAVLQDLSVKILNSI